MQEMDGFALAEQIKKDPELAASADHDAHFRAGNWATRPVAGNRNFRLPYETGAPGGVAAIDLHCVLRPAHRKESSRTLAAHHLRKSRGTIRDILLAEDNVVNQKLAVRLLEKRGHLVSVAGDGRQVLAALEKEEFDWC